MSREFLGTFITAARQTNREQHWPPEEHVMPNQREESTAAVEKLITDAVINYKHSGTSSDTYNPKIAGTLKALQ